MTPFDPMRAAFLLIAAVIGSQIALVFLAVGMCAYHAPDIIAGAARCEANGKTADILNAALAAALAFSGRNKA